MEYYEKLQKAILAEDEIETEDILYKIEEEDYSNDGYETKITNKTGLIEGDSHIDVVVTNTYIRPFKNPVTGHGAKTLLVIAFLSIVILGISVRNKKIIRKFRK